MRFITAAVFILLVGQASAQSPPPTMGPREQVLAAQRNSAMDIIAQCAVSNAELQAKIAKLEQELAHQLGDPRNKEEK